MPEDAADGEEPTGVHIPHPFEGIRDEELPISGFARALAPPLPPSREDAGTGPAMIMVEPTGDIDIPIEMDDLTRPAEPRTAEPLSTEGPTRVLPAAPAAPPSPPPPPPAEASPMAPLAAFASVAVPTPTVASPPVPVGLPAPTLTAPTPAFAPPAAAVTPVEVPSPSPAAAEPRPRPSRRRWLIVGGIVGAIVTVGVVGALIASHAGSGPAPAPAAPDRSATADRTEDARAAQARTAVDAAAAAPDAAPAAPATVTLRLTIRPAAARPEVELRGQRYPGATFTSPALPRGTTPETVTVRARGYREQALSLTLDQDVAREVTLEPEAAAPRVTEPMAGPPRDRARPRPRPRPRPRAMLVDLD
jgi:hypothetical protein